MDKNAKHKRPFRRAALTLILVIVLGFTLLGATAMASSIAEQGAISTLDSGYTLDGTGFFAGNTVVVNGDVNGSAFAAGTNIYINGTVNGDLFVAGTNIEINGTVLGNIYGAGQDITYNSNTSQGDVAFAGQRIYISTDAVANRELFAAGTIVNIDGTVARDFYGAGADITISGTVGRNVWLDAQDIQLLSSGTIGGDLYYRSEQKANLRSGTIQGNTEWKKVERTHEMTQRTWSSRLMGALFTIVSSILIWTAITLLKPEVWEKTSAKIFAQPLKTLGVGALALIVTPILTILIMLTVVGIPLAVLMGTFYGIFLYLSRIIVAVFIGKWLAKSLGWKEVHKGFWLTLLGLILITVLAMVPYLRILIWLLVVFTGLGSLITGCLTRGKKEPQI